MNFLTYENSKSIIMLAYKTSFSFENIIKKKLLMIVLNIHILLENAFSIR